MTAVESGGATTELAISGMTCASCVAHVGRALRKVPGVDAASVNLATERATVDHGTRTQISELVAAVEKAGYAAAIVRDSSSDEDARRRDSELRGRRRLLILGIALLVPTVVLGMSPLEFAGKDWLMLGLTLPVWAVVGGAFHRGALTAARHGTTNMDTLVSLGSTAALAYSIYATITMQPSYYETASAIVTLVFIGKYLETAARNRSNHAIRALLHLRPAFARIRERDGSERSVAIDDVRVGDLLLIAAGERIPVDGIIEEGEGAVDASMLTGESLPTFVERGSHISQGTLCGDGALVVRASAVGAGTTLAKIVEAVRRAQGTTPPVQRLADAVASIFVPCILAIAALTFGGWMLAHHAWPQALAAAIAVLVVACPCALGLATPTAIIAAAGAAAKRGLLFRDADALERLGAVGMVLFDKTGTLTKGKPEVLAVRALGNASENDVLAAAAALERLSTHPLAAAIVRAASDRFATTGSASNVVAQRGAGLTGEYGGHAVTAGNAPFLESRGVSLAAIAPGEATRVFVASDGQLLGSIDLSDAARPEAREALEALSARGIEVSLVSGDAEAPTRFLANDLKIDRWHARATPAGKGAIVEHLRAQGERVAFIGDGINDAPALAAADVGIAMGAGTEVALETAQVVILSNDPRAVAIGIAISRAAIRTIKQNLFWAFAYNVVLVPLAAAGIVHPILAAAAMGASSLFVVGNSLLLARRA